MFRATYFACLFAVVLCLEPFSFVPAIAADRPPPPMHRSVSASRQALLAYINEKAVLLLLRTNFNVLPESDVLPVLEDDLKRLGPDGPSDTDQRRLDDQLSAEGSYYLVSLRYTIEAGGAVWPKDRTESSYEADSLARLDILQDQLFADVASGSDPLPALSAAQSIWALTNGLLSVPTGSDFRAKRDTLVQAALRTAAPWADA